MSGHMDIACWPWERHICYDLKSLGLGKRTTLILSNTRELDRDLFTK